jgi:peptidoglycan hydrolase-like protein with peptidoglycan-binding domain
MLGTKKIVSSMIVVAMLGTTAVQARDNAAAFIGAAAAIAGLAAIANQNKKKEPKYRPVHKKRSYKKKSHKKKYTKKSKTKKTIVTDEMRTQMSLAALGFYGGKIDGNINSYESRSAIKKMNESYGLSSSSALTPESKDQLIYLSHLYEIDKYLQASDKTRTARDKKLQAALKVHDVYTGKIDGVVGNGTRMSIAKYRMKEGMVPETFLTESEKAELIDSAIRKNINNIEMVVASINKKAQPAVEKTPVYANQEKQVANEQQTPPASLPVSAVSQSASVQEKRLENKVEHEEDEFAMPEV